MFAPLLGALITFLLAGAVSVYAHKKWVSKWAERDFAPVKPSLVKVFGFSTAVGTASAVTTGLLTQSVWLAALFGLSAYFLTFAGIIDFQQSQVPHEMTTAGIISSMVFSAAAYLSGSVFLDLTITGNLLNDSLIQVGAWVLMLAFFFVTIALFIRNGMGWADFKILFMIGFAYVGFIGFTAAGALLVIGFVLQSVAFIVRRIMGIKKSGKEALPLIPALSLTYIIGSVAFLAIV